MYEFMRRRPEGFDVDTHFRPSYDPWDQRMCMVPDGDFFAAVRAGKADVVTDHVEAFVDGHVIPQGWRQAMPNGVRVQKLLRGGLLGLV